MKKIYTVIILIILTVNLSACGKKKDDLKNPTGSIIISDLNPYIEKASADEILEEQYWEEGEKVIYIYYMNTDSICADSFLPVYVIQTLHEKTQDYLESQGYYELSSLTVIDETVWQKSTISHFEATMDGCDNKRIVVEYSYYTQELTFSIQ